MFGLFAHGAALAMVLLSLHECFECLPDRGSRQSNQSGSAPDPHHRQPPAKRDLEPGAVQSKNSSASSQSFGPVGIWIARRLRAEGVSPSLAMNFAISSSCLLEIASQGEGWT